MHNKAKKLKISSQKSDWLSITQAAKVIGVSADTLRRWEKTGKLNAKRTHGSHRRYHASELETILKNQPEKLPRKKPITPKIEQNHTKVIKEHQIISKDNQMPKAPTTTTSIFHRWYPVMLGVAFLAFFIAVTATTMLVYSYYQQTRITSAYSR